MPAFEYEAIDRDGRVRTGVSEAAAEGPVRSNLTRQGLFVLTVRRAGGGTAGITVPTLSMATGRPLLAVWKQALERIIYRVKITEMVLFTGQLSAMVESGLQLLRALRALAAETVSKRFGKAIEQVAADVEAGSTFAGALEKHPWAFNKIYVSLTRAGEASGQLPGVLNQLTTYLEKIANLRRKIIGALAYPAIILGVTAVILFIMIIKIVPIFENVYNRVNAPLPAPTQMLIFVSQMIRSNLLVTLGLILLIAIGLYLAVQTERGRYLFDRFKLKLPVFGPLIRKSILAKVCRTLSTLIQSGVPLLEALEISADVAENRLVEDAIRESIVKVREGGTVSDSFRQSGQFPSLVTQMVGTGEETGQLPQMLGKSALYYEQQVDTTVAALSTLLEPILIVIMGIIAGAIIISLYLPIFNLGRAIRGGAKGF